MSIGSKIRSLFKKRAKSHNDVEDIHKMNVIHKFDYSNDGKCVQYFSVDKNKIVNTVVPAHMNVYTTNGNRNEPIENFIENESVGNYIENNFLYDNYYSIDSELNSHSMYSSNNTSSRDSIYTTDTISNYINKYFYYNEETKEYHFTDFDYTRSSVSTCSIFTNE